MLTLPVEPMLAAAAAVVPEPGALRGGCVYEPKFDGYRGLVFVEPDPTAEVPRVRVQSRGGHDITVSFPEIAAAAARQIPAGVVLDGELVVWDGTRLDFSALASRLAARRRAARYAVERPAALMVFDVLAVEGRDIRSLPLRDRRLLLEEVLGVVGRPPLQRVPSTTEVEVARGWMVDYARVPGLGIEGLVIKGLGTPYQSGQRGWLKHKIRDTHEVVVGAVTGSVAAPTRLVLGYPGPDGRLRVAGATAALGRRQAVEVGRLLVPVAEGAAHPWRTRMPVGWLGNWAGRGRETVEVARVEPRLVVEVSADTAFERGRWRHLVRFVRVPLGERDPHEVRPPG